MMEIDESNSYDAPISTTEHQLDEHHTDGSIDRYRPGGRRPARRDDDYVDHRRRRSNDRSRREYPEHRSSYRDSGHRDSRDPRFERYSPGNRYRDSPPRRTRSRSPRRDSGRERSTHAPRSHRRSENEHDRDQTRRRVTPQATSTDQSLSSRSRKEEDAVSTRTDQHSVVHPTHVGAPQSEDSKSYKRAAPGPTGLEPTTKSSKTSGRTPEDHSTDMDVLAASKTTPLHNGEADMKASKEAGMKVSKEADMKVSKEADMKISQKADMKISKEADMKISKKADAKISNDDDQEQSYVVAADDSESEESEFDMFADPDEIKPKKEKKSKSSGPIAPKPLDASVDVDDHEGYYKFFKHELMHKRYHIIERLGKGSYATVFRALDILRNNEPVAIKIIRNNAMMTQGAKEETEMLRRIHDFLEQHEDYDRSIVELKTHFMHRKHFCMVFENMGYNLRDVMDKTKGGNVDGVSINAVTRFARQLFSGLRSLRELGVFHGDLKPDNILMNPGPNPSYIKIADLGTARKDHGKVNVSDLLEMRGEMGSRFYRPPEVILGIHFGCDMDVWAAGCTLFEIFTGKILFTGENNCEMLYQMQKALGPIGRKYFRQGVFFDQYFEDAVIARFIRPTLTKTGHTDVKRMVINGPLRPDDPETIKARLRAAAYDQNDKEEMAKIDRLADLIKQCLVFDHDKRIGPRGALEHPFIAGVAPASAPKPKEKAKPLFVPSSVGNTDRLKAKRAQEEKKRKKVVAGVETEEAVEEKKGKFKFGGFKPIAR